MIGRLWRFAVNDVKLHRPAASGRATCRLIACTVVTTVGRRCVRDRVVAYLWEQIDVRAKQSLRERDVTIYV